MPRALSWFLRRSLPAVAVFVVASASLAGAGETYRLPPPPIVDILDAPETPAVSVDPRGALLLLTERGDLPPISDLAQPMLRLGGYRLNPATNGNFTTSFNKGFTLQRIDTGATTAVDTPPGARLGGASWAPDGSMFAFTITRDNGIELWVADATGGPARKLTGAVINDCGDAPGFRWMPDSRFLLARVVPDGRGTMPEAPRVPAGPIVQENTGRPAPVRTYQDLLESPHDEAVFDYLMTAQVVLVDARKGTSRAIGSPGVYLGLDPSPNGKFLLVTRLRRPYSFMVPADDFPASVEIWTASGDLVHTVAELPLRDDTPIEGVPVGPRNHQWLDTEDSATLLWMEALDGGDPKRKVDHRDRVLTVGAPFNGEPMEIARTEHRCFGLSTIHLSSFGMMYEYDRNRRWTRTWIVSLTGAEAPRLVWDRSVNDRYGDPGRPQTVKNRNGRTEIRVSDGFLFLAGNGASPEGERPFLDRMNTLTLETTRIWQCAIGAYESVVDVQPEKNRFLTRRETPEDPPNYFARSLDTTAPRTLTDFPDPAPQLKGITKQLLSYTRKDGVALSATLYLPAGYTPGTRLPLIVWAYPREFNDAGTAGQVSGSQYRFTRIRGTSHLFLLTQGYAILDGASMPIVGDPETMNDTFVEQVVESARAAIDTAAMMGVADPARVGVGGHSYGAFMTANLLAHCDLFRAGVARSGAYNRTLTPFGFQGERRTLWEAKEAYSTISPFMFADRINEPLLLIHGEIDNNSGTFPMQSERLYHAIKGHGGTVRYVVLPYESHGYLARESVLHTLAEMVDWFDRYVKNANVAGSGGGGGPAGGARGGD